MSAPAEPGRFRLPCWALPLGLMALLGIGLWCATVTSMALVLVTVGVPLSPVLLLVLRAFADLHRRRLTEVTGVVVPPPLRAGAAQIISTPEASASGTPVISRGRLVTPAGAPGTRFVQLDHLPDRRGSAGE
ncbi:sensor domain-containing protein [Nocardia macrotermitis]|uniref:Putative sensor domain-containing protein n=1 Tax=Nocardia macrotermitis TaxID=2585198 RepID=A0A7K0D480_9NOCA|nr:sensor domain-containing protein [Nocardia macrotermitis]MQY20538.1 hypothetical protein [Nocardia macrotermitis]